MKKISKTPRIMSIKQSLLLMTALLFAGLITAEGVRAQAQTGNIPSDERSSFEERRKSILDANNLRATYHNFGFSGRTTDANVDELFF